MFSLNLMRLQGGGIEEKMKVGIFGGTFDPIHNGHIAVADAIYKSSELDEIVFMPSYISPHKQFKHITDPDHRIKMLNLAVEGFPFLMVSTFEIDRKETSYTYVTMQELQNMFPENEYYFIIGADMVFDLPNWYRVRDLLKECSFIAMQRPGYKSELMDKQIAILRNDYCANLTFVEVPQMDLSSTVIREKIRKGESVSHLLPQRVKEYIDEHALYGMK